jgi:hypothetical protein
LIYPDFLANHPDNAQDYVLTPALTALLHLVTYVAVVRAN